MKRCLFCSNEATFNVEGYIEDGRDSGFVCQPVCNDHIKLYHKWYEDNSCDEDINGFEYITNIDNVAAGDRIREYTRLTHVSKGKYVLEDEEWEALICGLEFGSIVCNILTEEQLFVLAQALRRRIYDMVGSWINAPKG